MNEKYTSGKYTKAQVLDSFRDNKIDDIYKRKEVNYQSVANDTGEFYSEILAKEVFENLQSIDTSSDYLFPNKKPSDEKKRENKVLHLKKDIIFPLNTNRNEENIAKTIFALGLQNKERYEVIDYQVPVNRVQYSSHGKVDLLIKDKENNKLYISELKDEDSKETLLRAVSEVKTYIEKIKYNKLLKQENQTALTRFKESYKVESDDIVPAVIFCSYKGQEIKQENSRNYVRVFNRPKHEFQEFNKNSALYKLCKAWDINFFELVIEKTNKENDYENYNYTLNHLIY